MSGEVAGADGSGLTEDSPQPPPPCTRVPWGFEDQAREEGQQGCRSSQRRRDSQQQQCLILCLSSAKGHHAGGEDADAPVAGGADKLKYNTRAQVA